jgi:type II secretory pathway pseudopilin PulG
MVRARSGFSLAELLVAMSLTLAVFAITLPFVRAQSRALGANAGRLDAEQVARYAQRAIDHDLRVASADVGQPLLVHAGPMAVSFNANLLAADSTDPGALDVQTGADSTLTEAWRVAQAGTLPLTARTYPTADYLGVDGGLSRNETISYFLRPDTVSGRSDVYVLYRQVNARDSVQIVRGIHVPTDSAFFSYFRETGGALAQVPTAELPMFWDSTAIAQVRAVGVRSSGFFRNRQENTDVIRTVNWRVRLANRGASGGAACVEAPANPSTVQALTPGGPSNPYRVLVRWTASASDDVATGGVSHYVVRTRPASDSLWRPVATVPATGVATYEYEHYMPSLLGSVRYGVQAVGCAMLASGTVVSAQAPTLP